MRRLALLGTAVFALTTGVAACGSSPVEPGASTAAAESTPSFARKPSSQQPSSVSCTALVYPVSLCSPLDLQLQPGQREALCAALRYGGSFNHPVVGRAATETFVRNSTGVVETVEIPRPYGLPSTFLTFRLTDTQIESAGMCQGVVTTPPTA
jgi:hypothetical protein